MKPFQIFLVIFLLSSIKVYGFGDASSFKVKIYGAWLSSTPECTNPVEIMNSATGTEIDLLQSPNVGQGSIPDGTYKCLILKVNDVMKYTPSSTSGTCTSGTEETLEACVTSNTVNSSRDPITGATITCTDNSVTGDQLYIYVSRNAHCTGFLDCSGHFPNAFLPPTTTDDYDHGFKLDSDIVISGDTNGTIVFNTDGQVNGTGGSCNLEGFLMSFR